MNITRKRDFKDYVHAHLYNLVKKIIAERRGGNVDAESATYEALNGILDACNMRTPQFPTEMIDEFDDSLYDSVFSLYFDLRDIVKPTDSVTDHMDKIEKTAKNIVNREKELRERANRLTKRKFAETFVKERLQFKEGAFTTKDEAYNVYLKACAKEKIVPFAKNIFGKIVKAQMPNVETARKRIKGKATYGWRNLARKQC